MNIIHCLTYYCIKDSVNLNSICLEILFKVENIKKIFSIFTFMMK